MTTGEITAIVTVISTVLTFVGITGIDPAQLTQIVTGGFALVAVVSSIVTYVKHRNVVQETTVQQG